MKEKERNKPEVLGNDKKLENRSGRLMSDKKVGDNLKTILSQMT